MSSQEPSELARYQLLLSHGQGSDINRPASEAALQEMRMAPLVWWDVKEELSRMDSSRAESSTSNNTDESTAKSDTEEALRQYAMLGHIPTDPAREVAEPTVNIKPVLLNTNSPWSAFLCGSQGSGKSHTLSCMLENCLLTNKQLLSHIGKNPNPLAGLVFHYDSCQGSGVCEAAYLCSQIPTTVLVSPSNYLRLKEQYKKMSDDHGGDVKVRKLRLLSKYLDTERVKTLMAVGKEGEMPLYMQLLVKILRDMARKTGGVGAFDYHAFKKELEETAFLDRQSGPLKMRIELLESFLNLSAGSKSDYLTGEPGTLTIIDLTDPVIDADSACVLFDICLSVFIAQTECGKIVAVDEAHNYMSNDSTAVKTFTDKLLKTVREQRHLAARVVIATQEPTINTQLLDLCSITMVHRCTSPAWFAVLKKHIAALYLSSMSNTPMEEGEVEEGNKEMAKDDKALFQQIVRLKLGESLLFCPTAAVRVAGGAIERMVDACVRFRTRQRVTADGGLSKLAGNE
ncbi:hypothetical protein K469DRAFT_561992 [Zopfia rhizophila CBS 207.26]|uniref:AAA+ ATPase domain-containing protein n=1 Tax=Zopfia rhizophila CBS 207.26 TaxID=1314779 RepID=A0A6A6EDG0_9PEZI|nr:hypothetical protein K469DRAFT_561992 [Zopfia rhizophila CBS 207.26]